MSDDSSNPLIELPKNRSSKLLTFVEVALTAATVLIVPSLLVGYLLLGVIGGMDIEQTLLQFIYTVLVQGIVIVFVRWLMKRYGLTWRGIGVSKPGLRSIGWTLLGFGGYILAYMLIFAAVTSVISLDTEQRQQLGFDTDVAGVRLLLVFISLVILPPLVEEIVFRGYLYTRLKRAFRVLPAALIISVLFSLGHLQLGSGAAPLWVAALDTFVLSMVLVWLREKTGNIWAGVGVHALKNALAFTSLFIIGL